jgi:purine-binding chemotaxis protein CheW
MSDDARRILEERARALARRPEEPPAEEGIEVVRFAAGGERYALEARLVAAVFRLGELTPLPGAPAPVAGVTAWRGELLTLHDLRPPGTARPAAGLRVVAMGDPDPLLGFLADEVEHVSTLLPAGLGPPPEAGAVPLRGVTEDAVLVVDGEALMRTYTRE